MTAPADLAAAFVAALGAGESSTSGGGPWSRATIDVPPDRWVDALRAARDSLSCDFFDWLSAVDELPGGFTIVAHLWSTTERHGLLLRTTLPRETPSVASVVDLFPGAAWHERETHEMFGIAFEGPLALVPLLLPPEFEGHPLRKEFVLASRVAKPWPGAKEPGESEHGTGKRAPMRPPGVPAAGEWPARASAPGDTPDETPAARPARAERPVRAERPPRPDRPARERPASGERPAAEERPAAGEERAAGEESGGAS